MGKPFQLDPRAVFRSFDEKLVVWK